MNKAFVDHRGHFFLQREKNMIHINKDLSLINLLPRDYLETKKYFLDGKAFDPETDLREIELEEFCMAYDIAMSNLALSVSK